MSLRTALPFARRNFQLNVLNGTMMSSANSFIHPELVLTAFAAQLTDNLLILGMIAPLPRALWSLPQIWMVNRVQHTSQVLPIYRYTVLVRLVIWATLIVTIFTTHSPLLLLSVLFGFIIVVGLVSGIAGLPFLEITSKTIAPRRRGMLFSLRHALGALIGLAGAQVVIFFTGPNSHFSFPANFGWLFLIAAILQIIGGMAFALIKEPCTDTTAEHPALSWAVLRSIWRSDGNFRHYTLGRTLFMLSRMADGMILVYANQRLGVRLELVGLYLLIIAILKPVASLLAGWLSVQFGSRVPVVIGQIIQMLSWGLLLLMLPLGIEGKAAESYLFVVYSLIAIQQGLVFSNLMALGLNVIPSHERALYLGMLNTWVGFVILASAFSGVIVQLTGYQTLFILTALFSGLSIYQFYTLHEMLDEPAV